MDAGGGRHGRGGDITAELSQSRVTATEMEPKRRAPHGVELNTTCTVLTSSSGNCLDALGEARRRLRFEDGVFRDDVESFAVITSRNRFRR